MRVLALEPYYGGSHRAFLDGWIAASRHDWTLLSLPAFKWKWRMRHSPHSFADDAGQHCARGQRWDLLFCSDMLNLAEFYGLAPPMLREIPAVAYFHENQLTYPVQFESERDYHFGYTNMTTALAATRVWFNSTFNRDSFLAALPAFLKRMPDYQPFDAAETIRAKSDIQAPGIDVFPPRPPRADGPLRILWAARWEHDKRPDVFFDALRRLRDRGVAFRVSVIGESFRRVPAVFVKARDEFRDEIDQWGYQQSRAEYVRALHEADVFVSTADHEFFGLSAVEALAAGAYPLLPRRLAYPELLADWPADGAPPAWYDGSASALAGRLAGLAERVARGAPWPDDPSAGVRAVAHFAWTHRAPEMDEALERLTAAPRQRTSAGAVRPGMRRTHRDDFSGL